MTGRDAAIAALQAQLDVMRGRLDALEGALADAVSGGDLLRTEIRDVLADQPDDVLTGGGRAFVTSPTAGPAHD